ncbi:hypothetical protein A4D02_35270 [Niastella koreensis]|uniref:Uncharacterized protein n=1 Tax=Niastella koreensis TaxID=354356 RepID=A0ABX3NSP4_9BACT|nr:hypothetical protein [Niastella koreensis]OQP44318.1 hypothetical protein A4D02_35270 [Niastella koreensis]
MNKQKDQEGENAFMAEGAWRLKKAAIYTRYEFTEKSAEELVLEPAFESHTIFGIHAFTLGGSYDLFEIASTRVAAGGQ